MKRLFILIIFLSAIFFAAAAYYNSAPQSMQETAFTVKYGDSLGEVAYQLEKRNLIKDRRFFKIASYLLRRKYVRAGKYRIYEGMTSTLILKKLSRGDVITRKVTIPEGFNLYQIAERLDENAVTVSGNFLYYSFNRGFLLSLNIEAPSAEGYLFPDTYVFPEGSDPRDVIAIMHNKMKNVLSSINNGSYGKMNERTHRLLTLASLVEKEAKIPEERVYVSSVFHNRIKRDYRLDCDPTVRYAVKKFTGSITYNDLAYDSPYNTYKRKGLPPTPICSPGREAIIATINPKKTSYLYFVARNDGSHYFSKSLKEHNRAVNYYQKGIKNGFVDKQKLH